MARINIVLIALLVAAVPAVVFFWPIAQFLINAPSCSESSDAVAYARSLSTERLARLYHQMQASSDSPNIPARGNRSGETTALPPEFSDLMVKAVRPKEGTIMVEHCMDQHVYMQFIGLNSDASKQSRKVVLHWGEDASSQGSEVLWSERPLDSGAVVEKTMN